MHPIVERMGLNERQREAVVDRGGDIVVTAGAGTGKTLTLVARYLSLLAEDVPLRSIVAVTFTRKAAREMRNRVRDEMRRYVSRSPAEGPEGSEGGRWAALQRELDAARIDTIHSLCAEILRSAPAEARVDPAFDVLDEGRAGIEQAEALRLAMAWAADTPATAPLFRLLDDRGLRDCLQRLMASRLDAAAAFEAAGPDPLAAWAAAMARAQARALDALRQSEQWQHSAAVLARCDPSDPDDLLAQQVRAALQAVDNAHGSTTESLATLADLDRINLRCGRAAAWPGGKAQLQEVKTALRTLRSMWRENKALLGLELGPADEDLAAALPGLQSVFEFCVAAYDRAKRDLHALDYDDLERQALRLLSDDSSVAERWQTEVQAILVDEFQDTNGRQREIVSLLNGGRGRLFVVGDAKQSIYRFRGADVTVFRSTRQAVADGGGKVVRLDKSYRSHAGLLSTFDSLLGPVLGDCADDSRPWVEPYGRLEADRADPAPGFREPFVELLLGVGPKDDGGLLRAAGLLADRLIDLVEGGEGSPARASQPSRIGYGDIAILCRGARSFGAYEDALEQAGIPFVTVSGRGFYDRPEIRDLLNALAALSDPTDDLALVGLLRSPVIGMSDPAIHRLCRAWRRVGRDRCLWTWLAELGPDWPPEYGAALPRGVALVHDLHAMVGRTGVGEVLKAFLDATDYRSALGGAGQNRAVRNIDKLLADAHASTSVGVGEFAEYVGHLRDVGSREGEARAIAGQSVQIMSVHAAKGLEFPVVVLGDAGFSSRRRDDVLLDRELGVLLPLQDEEDTKASSYLLAKKKDEQRDAAESDRLLYVAATRACELLLVSGCLSINKNGSPGKLSGWLAALAGQLRLSQLDLSDFDPDGAECATIDLPVGARRVEQVRLVVAGTGFVPLSRPPPSPEHPAARDEPKERLLEALVAEPDVRTDDDTQEREYDPPRTVWRVVPTTRRACAPAWVVGKLVHEAIAEWRLPDDPAGDKPFRAWAQSRARAHGLTDGRQLSNAAERCAELVRRFSACPLRHEMESAERLLHEVPYSRPVAHGAGDGGVEIGVIDALFRSDGRWTLVEFKTDRLPRGLDMAAYLSELGRGREYRHQVSGYAAAVARLLSTQPQTVLCLLDVGGEVRIERDLLIPGAARGSP